MESPHKEGVNGDDEAGDVRGTYPDHERDERPYPEVRPCLVRQRVEILARDQPCR